MKLKKLTLILVYAFALNFIWENLHSHLYIHYKSGEITQWVLARATLFDAIFITFLGFIFLQFKYFNKRLWLIFVFGVAAAVLIEWHALGSGRWAYKEIMPIIPLIKTGLTPTIQLAVLSYVSFKLAKAELK